jgi:hypothetical protein
MLHTGLTGGGVDWSERFRAELLQLPCFKWCFACIHPGGVTLVQGELACVFFVGFSSFGLVVCALCLSIVLPRMCRAVALA